MSRPSVMVPEKKANGAMPGVDIDKPARKRGDKAGQNRRYRERYPDKIKAYNQRHYRQMNSPFKIERGIPPPLRSNRGRGFIETFKLMEKGDSVLLPTKLNNVGGMAGRIFGTGTWAAQQKGKNKVRIWRLE